MHTCGQDEQTEGYPEAIEEGYRAQAQGLERRAQCQQHESRRSHGSRDARSEQARSGDAHENQRQTHQSGDERDAGERFGRDGEFWFGARIRGTHDATGIEALALNTAGHELDACQFLILLRDLEALFDLLGGTGERNEREEKAEAGERKESPLRAFRCRLGRRTSSSSKVTNYIGRKAPGT